MWVCGLERLQFAEHAVVFGIGHGGLVQHVILVGPLIQLGAQGGSFCFQIDSCLRFIFGRWSRKKV